MYGFLVGMSRREKGLTYNNRVGCAILLDLCLSYSIEMMCMNTISFVVGKPGYVEEEFLWFPTGAWYSMKWEELPGCIMVTLFRD